MLGTHTRCFLFHALSCQRVPSLLARNSGVQSLGQNAAAVIVYVQNPGGFLLHAWAGKEIGGKSGRFGKEVRGPDYPNILIMRQQTILVLYLPRLCLLQTECLH